MNETPIYSEHLSSNRTEALFVALALFAGGLFLWRLATAGQDLFAGFFAAIFAFFLFYALNYRTLAIQLTGSALTLRFGLFTWRVPLDNIAAAAVDEMPALLRWGGAGIHFLMVDGRYRASFNFLEYPRLVIAFKRKAGPVRDISFSTRQPEALLQRLDEALAAWLAAGPEAGGAASAT